MLWPTQPKIGMQRIVPIAAFLLFVPSVTLAAATHGKTHSLVVMSTAYTTATAETQSVAPGVTAWGEHLTPGMKAIAVSRDLIAKGLTHNVKVHIEGLNGTYVVLDKMSKRWTNKIDIFIPSRQKAREWGKRKVKISWTTPTK